MRSVQRLGWACFLLTTEAGTRILVDPYLSGSAEFDVAPSPIGLDELGDLDIVAVTHAGFDHLGEAFQIVREREIPLVTSIDVSYRARFHEGIPEERVFHMAAGGQIELHDVRFRGLDTRHVSISVIGGVPVFGNPLSFLIDDGVHRVYHSGDTALTLDLELYGRVHRPHLVLLSIGGCLINGQQAIMMTVEEAVLAAQFLGAPLTVPMHYRRAEEAADFARLCAARWGGHVQVLELGDSLDGTVIPERELTP